MDKAAIEKRVNDFLTEALNKLGISAVTVASEETADGLVFSITGEDAAKAIGYRGEVLDALQYLATSLFDGEEGDLPRIYVDAESYREKRKRVLTKLAERLAYKAYKSGRRQALEPMNPYERRIIHFALQDSEYAETVSEGEGRNRHIVVVPKNQPVKAETDDGSMEIRYGHSDFARKGPGKTRSFGGKRRRF